MKRGTDTIHFMCIMRSKNYRRVGVDGEDHHVFHAFSVHIYSLVRFAYSEMRKCECIKQMRPSIDVTVLIFIYSQQYATSIRTECYSPMTNELNRTVSSHVIWVPSKLPCSDFCPTTIKPSTVEYCLLNPSSRICYASAITNKWIMLDFATTEMPWAKCHGLMMRHWCSITSSNMKHCSNVYWNQTYQSRRLFVVIHISNRKWYTLW